MSGRLHFRLVWLVAVLVGSAALLLVSPSFAAQQNLGTIRCVIENLFKSTQQEKKPGLAQLEGMPPVYLLALPQKVKAVVMNHPIAKRKEVLKEGENLAFLLDHYYPSGKIDS